jgi:hypothetical protein
LADQLVKHPLAIAACVPKDASIFATGASSGAAAKTVTTPLERIKLLMVSAGVFVTTGRASRFPIINLHPRDHQSLSLSLSLSLFLSFV